jgi:hypothetical protein
MSVQADAGFLYDKAVSLCVKSDIYSHSPRRNSPSGPGPPHYGGFTITFGRTPLDEWSARRRDLYLRTHNTHRRQSFMPQVVGFEPAIPESQWPQAQALDRAAIGVVGLSLLSTHFLSFHVNSQTCIPRVFKWFFKPPKLSLHQALSVSHSYHFCASNCVFGWLAAFKIKNYVSILRRQLLRHACNAVDLDSILIPTSDTADFYRRIANADSPTPDTGVGLDTLSLNPQNYKFRLCSV